MDMDGRIAVTFCHLNYFLFICREIFSYSIELVFYYTSLIFFFKSKVIVNHDT